MKTLWHWRTRFLHLGMAVTVTAQLFFSLGMEPSFEGEASVLEALLYNLHVYIGITALFIVLLHWVSSLFDQGANGWKHLFPWRDGSRQQLVTDLRGLVRGRLPESGIRGGLPGLVHGLGFLAVTGMAVSGGILYLTLPAQGEPSGWVYLLLESHEVVATLVWTYWGAHIGLALLHQLQGGRVLQAIFNLRYMVCR